MVSMRTVLPASVVVVLLLTTAGVPVFAQQPALADVLAKAGERVAALSDPTRVLTCEENYKQVLERVREIVGFDVGGPVGSRSEVAAVGMNTRTWVAELVILATPGNQDVGLPFREFRDVISIDGKPVRDGQSRLANLATLSLEVAGLKAVEASQDASAYLFGRLTRAIDIPRAALLFLHPANQRRFEFKKGGQRTIDGVKAWEIKFTEKVTPSIIRASGDKEAPSTGSFWVDPATGDVLESYLKSADIKQVYDELTVTYLKDADTGLRLPATLKEQIVDELAALRVQGKATFTKWRAAPRKKI